MSLERNFVPLNYFLPWQRRSQMEIEMYRIMCYLLHVPNVFHKKQEKRNWCRWFKNLAMTSRGKPHHKFWVVFLRHYLDYCEQALQKRHFTTAGIWGVWMCLAPNLSNWSVGLQKLALDALPFSEEKNHISYLLHPLYHPLESSSYNNNELYVWIPSSWNVKTKNWINTVSKLHPKTHQQLYQELNAIITQTVGMLSRCLRKHEFGHSWYDATDMKHFSACDIVPIWPRKFQVMLHDHVMYQGREDKKVDSPSLVSLTDCVEMLQFYVQILRVELQPQTEFFSVFLDVMQDIQQEKVVAFLLCPLEMKNMTQSLIEMWIPAVDFSLPNLRQQGLSMEDLIQARYKQEFFQEEQYLGKIPLVLGKIICFSSTLEFKIKHGTLLEESLPGSLTLLFLSLVDPGKPIVCQEPKQYPVEWLLEILLEFFCKDIAQLITEYHSDCRSKREIRQVVQEMIQQRAQKYKFGRPPPASIY